MLPLIRFISSVFWKEQESASTVAVSSQSKEETLHPKLLEILEAPDEEDEVVLRASCVDELDGEPEECFRASGVITGIGAADGFIDSKFWFERKDAPKNVRPGQTVEYVAYKSSFNSEIVVKKIIKIHEEWENSDDESEAKKTTSEGTRKKKEVFEKSQVCLVTKREGRNVYINPPGNYSFNLDSVHITFVPVKGDWLSVSMKVEECEESAIGLGEILEITDVMPLRFKTIEGVISDWKNDQNMGIINRETFFTLDACEIGYVPVVGDMIDAHIIESEQGQLSWRALKVIPSIERTNYCNKNQNHSILPTMIKLKNTSPDLFKDKYGIVISRKCNFGKLKFGKERELTVELKNSSQIVHRLSSFGFQNKFQSQMKLIEPDFKNRRFITIGSNEILKFVFRCKAKFFGKSSELFMWNFNNFDIGRLINVEVDDDHIGEMRCNTINKRPQRPELKLENVIPTASGFIISGTRPIRKAPFVPVKLGSFKVPDKYWEILVDSKASTDDVQLRLTTSMPCLNELLSPKNYENRWHTLLYLEEVEAVIALRGFDMPRVLFRKSGEFLVLDVPGVLERRPSLIVGDSVYATSPDDDGHIAIKYEGFIHKIMGNDVYIKFNPNFHNNYDDKDYNVSFCSNRSMHRKCHQAVTLAIKNLTMNWIFPSSLNPSAPLFILEEDEEEEKEEGISVEEVAPIEVNGGVLNDAYLNCEVGGTFELDVSGTSKVNGNNMNILTNTELEQRNFNGLSSERKEVSSNLKDTIFSVSLNNKTNDKFNNINKAVLDISTNHPGATTPPRIPVADWLMKTASNRSPPKQSVPNQSLPNSSAPNVRKRLTLLDFMYEDNSGMTPAQNNSAQSSLPAQIQTLEEIEKPLLKSSPPKKGMLMLNEVEDKLLEKSPKSEENKRQTPMKFREYKRKIEWNVGNMARPGMVHDISEGLERRKMRWFNKRLNHYQKEAVRHILQQEARPLPYIIFGPPGTGKTVTLVETVLQILSLNPDSRLLIGSPSNSAADCIAEKLIDTGLFQVGTLVRLCALSYFASNRCSDKLAPYCTTAEIRSVSGDQTFISEDGTRKSTREDLGRHRVTVGTCVALGSLYSLGFPQGHFTHVLIDEAGQATEPEILIPLCFLDNKTGQSVLVGDPQQLGPVLFSCHSKEFGLGVSLITRLLDTFPFSRDPQSFPATHGFDPRLVTQLVDNYRSLPEILKLPSQMFYEDRLVPHVKDDSFEASILLRLKAELPARNSKLPPSLVFHGVKGTNFREEDSPSWFNPQEVVQTVAYINKLYEAGLTCDDVGIITPYNKQAFKIRQLLTKLEVPLPKVGSVEEFQGQERLVIILSTVRSTDKLDGNILLKHLMGFISSPQRLNVGLTRARALLIILGNPHLLVLDPYWRTVLDYAIKNNAYCGCDAPETNHIKNGPEVKLEPLEN